MESDVLDNMDRMIVKSFLSMIILVELKKGTLSGYDIISFVHKKFHMLMSSGTVYSHLYALERDGLVKAQNARKKRVYTLTERGKETVGTLLNSKDEILELVSTLFVGD